MSLIDNISETDYNKLLKYPVYISLLAANNDSKLDDTEKKVAIKFSHIKTYSCNPLLTTFYEDADKIFEKNMEQLDKDLPVKKEERDAVIKKVLANLEKIVLNLGIEDSTVMHRSM